jgi:hypothetical protein
MIVGRAVLPTTTPLQPWRVPVMSGVTVTESKPTVAEIEARARAYELAKAELPAGASRAIVMAAADEIFAYLMYGIKPAPKAA